MQKKHLYLYTKLIITFILIVVSYSLNAQTSSGNRYDSTKVEIRKSSKIEEYRNDRDFQYEESAKKPTTFWERLSEWIFKILDYIFNDSKTTTIVRNIIIFLILAFVIIKLLGMKYQSLFFKNKKQSGKIDFETYDEEIYSMDLDKLILKAISENELNKAVRFLYLKLLKELTNNEIIIWQKNKTNREYRFEASKSKYGKSFSDLTYTYEYVWYGDFKIEQSSFQQIHQDFTQIFKQLV